MRAARAVCGLAFVAGASVAARAQVPTDSTRRDSTARRDTTQAAPADSVPPVRHLTELGANVRPGSVLYHVFVVAPRPAPPGADSLAGAPAIPGRDSAQRVAPPPVAAQSAPPAATTAPTRPDTAAPGPPPAAQPTPAASDSARAGAVAAAVPGAPTAPPAPVAASLDTTDLGTRSSSIAATVYGGAPAWILVSAGGRGIRAAIDSLVLAQSDLRPLHLGGTIGLTTVSAEFPGDSAFAAMSDPTGRRSVIAPVPRDAILSLEMLAAVLQVAPLAPGWTDSVHVAVIAPPTVTVDPATLTVVGEESAPTPLGPTACWIVSLRSPTAEARLWVAKDSRTVVRAEQALPSPAGAVLERVYVGGTTP